MVLPTERTVLAMSIYSQQPCSNLQHELSYLNMHSAHGAVVLKLHKHASLATQSSLQDAWVLIRVDFDLIQEVGPKVRGGHSFPRLQYIHTYVYIYIYIYIHTCMCKQDK